jgi:hypothetical protein
MKIIRFAVILVALTIVSCGFYDIDLPNSAPPTSIREASINQGDVFNILILTLRKIGYSELLEGKINNVDVYAMVRPFQDVIEILAIEQTFEITRGSLEIMDNVYIKW